MINSLHKKIILALMLGTQITQSMEQCPLPIAKFCQDAFVGESAFAVASILSNFVTSDITMPRDRWQKELSFKDGVLVTTSMYSGLLAGALFIAESKGDNFKFFIENCGHDNQQLAFASKIVWWSMVTSLVHQTAFIHHRAINQLCKEGNPHGKVTWRVLAQQVGLPDLLFYAFGFYLLMMFPAVGS